MAVRTCVIAVRIAGAFSLKLSRVKPLAAVCSSANAVFTCSTLGWSTSEAEATAGSRLDLTFSIAVIRAATPSSAGFTFARASSDDLSSATSAHAAAGAAVVGGAAAVEEAVAAGGLVWLGVEPVPQLASKHSRVATATAADADRRARLSRTGYSPGSTWWML